MDYEKKYKEAKGMAEEIIRYYKEHNRGDETSIEDLEQIFPELRESEDERIRKDLLAFIKAPYVYDFIVHDKVDPWIAWIEKQGVKKKEWSEEDEEMAEDLIKGCISAEIKARHFLHTSKEIADWLKSIKDRIKGKEEQQ